MIKHKYLSIVIEKEGGERERGRRRKEKERDKDTLEWI